MEGSVKVTKLIWTQCRANTTRVRFLYLPPICNRDVWVPMLLPPIKFGYLFTGKVVWCHQSHLLCPCSPTGRGAWFRITMLGVRISPWVPLPRPLMVSTRFLFREPVNHENNLTEYRLVWLSRLLWEQKIAGSNPATRTNLSSLSVMA